jgi:hypothetical protein
VTGGATPIPARSHTRSLILLYLGAAAEMHVDEADKHHLEADGGVHVTDNEVGPIMLVYMTSVTAAA